MSFLGLTKWKNLRSRPDLTVKSIMRLRAAEEYVAEVEKTPKSRPTSTIKSLRDASGYKFFSSRYEYNMAI